MQVDVAKDGAAVFRIGFADWIKAIVVIGACFYGHAKMQCSKIDTVADSLQLVSTRLTAAERGLLDAERATADLKQDYKETAKDLRASLKSIDEYLRTHRSSATPGSPTINATTR